MLTNKGKVYHLEKLYQHENVFYSSLMTNVEINLVKYMTNSSLK